MQTVAAIVFRAKWPAIMDEVRLKRETVVITKFGEPVAQLGPVEFDGEDPIFGCMRGKATIVGDIESPIPTEEWKRLSLQRNDHLKKGKSCRP